MSSSARLNLNLPEPIQASVDAGAIGPDVAYQLSKVEDAGEQAELAERAVAGSIRRDELQVRTRTAATARQGRGAAVPGTTTTGAWCGSPSR